MNNTQVMTIPQAVVSAINTLRENGKLSAYEVTTFIRNKANVGDWQFPGLDADKNALNIKYRIDHDVVRQIVHNLYENGDLDELGLVDRTNNGQYFEYHFDLTNSTDSDLLLGDSTSFDDDQDEQNHVNAKQVQSSSFNRGLVSSKVNNYLNRKCNTVNPTLKQIQSAVKVNGVTCEVLHEILKNLGYYVNTSAGNASQFFVS